MIQVDPEVRPTIDDVLKDHWFADMRLLKRVRFLYGKQSLDEDLAESLEQINLRPALKKLRVDFADGDASSR